MVTNGTNPPTSAKSESQNQNQPIVVEDYADRLIDDLFTDVERVLEGGAKLPSEAVQPEFVSLKSIQVPTIVLPETDTAAINPSNAAIDPEVVRDASADSSHSSFDRWLLGAAFTSLIVTLGLWVATRGGFSRLFAPAPVAVAPETTAEPENPADAEFAGYVERSLNMIQKRADALPTLPLVPPLPAPNATLPSLPVPGTPTSSPASPAADTNSLIQSINRVANTVESASREMALLSNRVMNALNTQLQQSQQVAVQTPTPGGQTSGSSSTVQVNTATPESNSSATAEATETTETTNSAPVAAAPIPQALPAPESIPSIALPAPSTPEIETTAAFTPAESAVMHTLVGILELGERSAALFEVNGVPRRIYIGENIAGSGWTLVEVANQEAVMRRNGEVRTIFVGQQF